MPSTGHPERKSLGQQSADARPLCWLRKTGLGLVIVAVLTLPDISKAEGLPALIRATTPFSGIGSADTSSRRQLAQSHADLETQTDQLFAQLLKDPKNGDLTLR